MATDDQLPQPLEPGGPLEKSLTASFFNRILASIRRCQPPVNVSGARVGQTPDGWTLSIDQNRISRPPKLWHLEIADLVIDPFSLLAKIMEDSLSAWDGALPAESAFSGIVDPLFDSFSRSSSAPGSSAAGIEGLFAPLYTLIAGFESSVDSIVNNSSPVAAALKAYFESHGTTPRDGDYVYLSEVGIAYTLFKQHVSAESGDTIPSGNLIFRVEFEIQLDPEDPASAETFAALTLFPAPDLFRLLNSLFTLVLNLVSKVLAAGLSSVTKGIAAGVLSGLNALFNEIDALLASVWSAINAISGYDDAAIWGAVNALQTSFTTLQSQVTTMQTALDAVEAAVTALEEQLGDVDLSATVDVSLIGGDGNYHTVKVLSDTSGGSAQREITWIDSSTGSGQRASFLVSSGASAPVPNTGSVDWRQVNYIHPDGTTYEIHALVNIANNEPIDDTNPNFTLTDIIVVNNDNSTTEGKGLIQPSS